MKPMASFASYDGTEISYRVLGDGRPLVCLPGGPGRAGEYLGDVGGLGRSRRLVIWDPRGVGVSADPADPATFRVDRLVEDVESLRVHLGLDRMDVLAHSAGAVLATLYAAVYPQHLSRLILVTPGLAAVGRGGHRGTVPRRSGAAGGRALVPGRSRRAGEDHRGRHVDGGLPCVQAVLLRPLGRSGPSACHGRGEPAPPGGAGGLLRRAPPSTRPRPGPPWRSSPRRSCSTRGDQDPMVPPAAVREAAPLFNDATVVVQPGAAHFPWVDDPAAFAAAISAFLS